MLSHHWSAYAVQTDWSYSPLDNNKNNELISEYLIPEVLGELIIEKKATTKVIKTTANWYGVTYKEDTPTVKKAINDLILNGEYTDNLWN